MPVKKKNHIRRKVDMIFIIEIYVQTHQLDWGDFMVIR